MGEKAGHMGQGGSPIVVDETKRIVAWFASDFGLAMVHR
jgi:hypothetical protein